MIYWIVVIGGTAVAITGYLLMFPFYATGMQGMQLAQTVHAIIAVLFVAAMLGHIYIGTHRHGRRVRGDGRGHGRRQLGEGASRALAGAGNGPHRPERDRSASRWQRRPNKTGENDDEKLSCLPASRRSSSRRSPASR